MVRLKKTNIHKIEKDFDKNKINPNNLIIKDKLMEKEMVIILKNNE